MPQNPEVGLVRRTLAAAVVIGVGGAMLAGCGEGSIRAIGNANTNSDGTEATAGQPTDACPDTWEMPGLPLNDMHRVVVDGMPELGNAANEEQARAALAKWVDEVVSVDDDVLFAYAREITGEEFNQDAMVDSDGCATDEAERARLAIETTIGLSDVSDGSVDLPADLTNTGVEDDGRVVIAAQPGISGDRSGVLIVTPDGKIVGFLDRCSNLAVLKPHSNSPTGRTDEPGVTPKYDDGRLPGDPNVPADQDKGTPDKPGRGPAGQKPDAEGYIPSETRPEAPSTTETQSSPGTPEDRGPATTNPRPSGPATTVVATTVVATSTPNTAPLPTAP